MTGLLRSFTTLAGVAAAGALVWFVPHWDRWSTGGYWAAMLTFVLAGLVLGVAQLRGGEGKGRASFVLVFAPLLVVSFWVALAAQPRSNWFRDHAVSWSGDIGVGHVVHNLAEHVAVLAFALGIVFGVSFELAMLPKRGRRAAPAAAPEPTPVAEQAPAEPAPVEQATEVQPPAEAQ